MVMHVIISINGLKQVSPLQAFENKLQQIIGNSRIAILDKMK